jgi:hypothetical protein
MPCCSGVEVGHPTVGHGVGAAAAADRSATQQTRPMSTTTTDPTHRFWNRMVSPFGCPVTPAMLAERRSSSAWLRPALTHLGFGRRFRAFTSLRDVSLRRNLRLSRRSRDVSLREAT